MLASIYFTNFKSWSEVDLTCGRITGIFGTNSSGKSSIVQFLLLLKQTKDATDRALSLELNGDFVQLGTIKDAVYQHDESLSIKYQLSCILKQSLSLSDPSAKKSKVIAKGDIMTISSSLSIQNKAPVATKLSYALGNMTFELASKVDNYSQFELKAIGSPTNTTDFNFLRTSGRVWQLPGPVKSYAYPDQARTYFQNAGFLADLEKEYENQLDHLFYLGPLREPPKRDYLWARSRPSDVGQKGERAIEVILAATEAGEKRNIKYKSRQLPFQEMIAHWLREMGLIYSFRVAEIAEGSNRWQARVKTSEHGSEVLLTDVGFGISQVLPVITLLQYVPEGSTVILEQPEIHLHPLAQAGLADLIIQASKHRKVQIILESHSEHLLLRLQRRIAEEVINSEEVKLYFCDAPKGTSTLTPLEVDNYGNIRNWPNKFMGDAFNEIASAEISRIERRKQNK